MSNLKGTLGDYVTVAMAVEMLGHRREQTGRFYNYVSSGLETHKLGGATLAKVKDFTSAAGLPAGTSSLWPAELACLPMSKLCSRNEAAELLGVAPGTVNRYAKIGKITAYDLSPWGGYTVYSIEEGRKGSKDNSKPKRICLGDWVIEGKLNSDGQLYVDLYHPTLSSDLFAQASFGNEYPRRVFYTSHVSHRASAIVTIKEDLE